MKEIDTGNMLAQLRANAAIAQNNLTPASTDQAPQGADSFSSLLQQSIDKVNDLQQQSGSLGKAFELGDPNVSLAEVMIAKEKAGVAFQSVLQVRKKLMEAYKEVMSMSV
jgi:flagellar hook-basal body complex protein FliE